MPSAFLWPMSVPSALRAPAPVNQGVRLPQNTCSGIPIHIHVVVLGHMKTWRSPSMCFATRRMASALWGCLSFGSQLTTALRQSASCHRPCGPPVLRQSAQHPGAPKCHSPSAFWLSKLGGLPPSRGVWHTAFKHQREPLCSITVHRTTARSPCAPRPLLRATASHETHGK